MRFHYLPQFFLIVVICLVSPCYQLKNDNVKVDDNNNAKASNLNQVLNAKKVIADRRQPIKAAPLHLTPQPLIIKRKIISNTVRPQNIAKSETPVDLVKKVDTTQEDTVQTQNGKPNIDLEFKSYRNPMFFDDQDIDDIIIIPRKDNNKGKPKSSIKQDTVNEEAASQTSKVLTKSEDKINLETAENKKVTDSDKLEIQNIASSDSKTQSVPAEENISKLAPYLKIEANEKPDIKNNIPPDAKLTISEKKNSSPILDRAANKNDIDIPKNKMKNKSATRNFKKDDLLVTNKLHLNIDPKLMKELTNDSNNKIYITNSHFEELQEKYNPSSKHITEEQEHDLNNTYDNPLRQKQAIFEDDDYNNNLKSDFTYDNFRTLNDRIWRKWKNTEIHIESDDFKDTETGITKESNRDICDCYSGNDFNPVDYTPYKFETDYENVYPKLIENPESYDLPTYPSCYQPKSYGYQYAPITRYQNYLFPCLY